ncbi:MAG TPA: efflux RND transporter periplasmic adaptor subunit [Terracidiphilus sp.]|jgi:HlyD family secretion protein|nr:efflux RND transporter periplasmic adaptor subunit [Terracidiphilus sp.]
MTKETKGLDRKWLWVGVAVLLAAVFFSARAFTREKLPVKVARAEHAPLNSTLSTNGRVEPLANYQYPSPISTTVKAVYVQPGDQVPAGKLLVVLDDADARARLAAAESGVKAAQAQLETVIQNGTLEQRQASTAELERDRLTLAEAQRNLDALTKLRSTGAASASEVAAAQQQVDTAQANMHAVELSSRTRYSPAEMDRARAALADAEASAAAARDVLAKTSFRAPVAGTVYTVDAHPTEFAETGKVLLQMADLRQERVRAYFDEPDIGRLSVGQPIQIRWDAKPGQSWHGHVVRIPITVITYTTRNVGEVLIDVDGAEDNLLPETNVTVTVTTASEADALSIPRDALYSESGKTYVFKVVKDQLVKTPVTTGVQNLTQVSILAGLKEGDIVATGTTSGLPLQTDVPIKQVQ